MCSCSSFDDVFDPDPLLENDSQSAMMESACASSSEQDQRGAATPFLIADYVSLEFQSLVLVRPRGDASQSSSGFYTVVMIAPLGSASPPLSSVSVHRVLDELKTLELFKRVSGVFRLNPLCSSVGAQRQAINECGGLREAQTCSAMMEDVSILSRVIRGMRWWCVKTLADTIYRLCTEMCSWFRV